MARDLSRGNVQSPAGTASSSGRTRTTTRPRSPSGGRP